MKKKILLFLLGLAMLFNLSGPALAMEPKPFSTLINISAPQRAEPGQSIKVELSNNISKTASKIDVWVYFPKSTVVAVKASLNGKKIAALNTPYFWVFTWKQEVKPRQQVKIQFDAVLTQKTGKFSLVEIYTIRGGLVAKQNIQITAPRPTATATAYVTPTSTVVPVTPTSAATNTPKPTITPTQTSMPTSTNTPKPTVTSLPTDVPTSTATTAPTASPTQQINPTKMITPTPTSTALPSSTPTQPPLPTWVSPTATATAVSELVWYASVPNVVVGGDRFVSTVTAQNSANVDQEIAVTIKILLNDGNDQTMVYTPYCGVGTYVKVVQTDITGVTVEWHGIVPANGNCQLQIENGWLKVKSRI